MSRPRPPVAPQPRALSPLAPNIGTLLLEAYRAFEDELFEAFREAGHSGLRPKHGRVLANIDREGTRATDLARRARMTKAAMGELVDELERMGYVEREADPEDRRAKRIRPTSAGLGLIAFAHRAIGAIETRWRKRLGKKRFSALTAAIAQLLIQESPPSVASPVRL